jgi:hypothetical protein
MVLSTVHFLDYPSVRGYVHCNGPSCLLCQIGRKQDSKYLWPVYDVIDQAVGVLSIGPSLRPQALKPQLFPVLEQLQKGAGPLLLGIRKLDNWTYAVNVSLLPENAEDGAAKIAAFSERFQAGAADLTCIHPRLSNSDLAAIPEVITATIVKGIMVS